ncbi:kinase-like protein [Imleria badia]|nr:kinase-like protein [Imleria badia]
MERLLRIAAGLAYLHSTHIVHGDFHPDNVWIDRKHDACLTDFGLSQTFIPAQDKAPYLRTDSIRPRAVLWAAPEMLHPHLYPDLKIEATFNSDIYSLGSIILFILSERFPWPDQTEAKNRLKELHNPPRPVSLAIPDSVWNFIEKCWSPRVPRDRPSAQKVLSFSGDEIRQLLQPYLTSHVNVVLFGAAGSGKSSIINLLLDQPIAPVSTDVEICTVWPQWYQVSIDGTQFQLWDTMGFGRGGVEDPINTSPHKQAYSLLRNLSGSVHLILLCADKCAIFASLVDVYRSISEVFDGGKAPIAFIVTHFDSPDKGWWKRNVTSIVYKSGIPVQSFPHACITTMESGRDQSKQELEALLQTYAATATPVPPRPDVLFY